MGTSSKIILNLQTQFQAMNPSTENNYNIDDLNSGDETDDDERPRKKIPNWANMKSTLFRASIMRQYQNRSSNPIDDIFYTINPNRDVDLTELFDSMASLHAQKRYSFFKTYFKKKHVKISE